MPETPAVDGTLLAQALGDVTRRIGVRHRLFRLIVAGGDTSGLVARAIGIEALELVAPLAPGAPLCRAIAVSPFDQLEICLKGGQVGGPDFFLQAAGQLAAASTPAVPSRRT